MAITLKPEARTPPVANRPLDAPVRVLHVVGGLNRGGIETWLMHMLRGIDRNSFRFDFLVHTREACAYDQAARELGCRIVPCLDARKPWRYARNFRDVLREYGPYDVVHSHLHHFSGFVLKLAHEAGVPVRIAHSHNDLARDLNLFRKGYYTVARCWLRKHATSGFGASNTCLAALFGNDWRSDDRWKRVFYSIDLAPFRTPLDRVAFRQKLGIPDGSFAIAHVGRFVAQKNHAFLLEIAREVVRRDPTSIFVLAGDGELRAEMEAAARRMGIAGNMRFIGLFPAVPGLLRSADAFLLPSLFEGLGLVLVEAQAAGLPCALSDRVPEEADIVAPLIHRLSLKQPPSAWAQVLLEFPRGARIDPAAALRMVASSPFNLRAGVERLEGLYRG